MEHNRRNPPEWKRELLRRIDVLARQPGVLALFREHIRKVAKTLHDAPRNGNRHNWKEFFGPGPALSLPEKVYLLAAFHDVFAEAERMAPVMEWEIDETKENWWRLPAYGHSVRYYGYGAECADLPDEELQPAVLQRYVTEVKAETMQATRNRPDSIAEKAKRCRTLVNQMSALHGAKRGSDDALRSAKSCVELCDLADSVAAAGEELGLDSAPVHAFLHDPRPELAPAAGAFLSRLLAKVSAGTKQATVEEGTEAEPTPNANPPEGIRQAIFWRVWNWPPWLKWLTIVLAAVVLLAFGFWATLPDETKQKIVDWIWQTL